jgi:hypothetical protein
MTIQPIEKRDQQSYVRLTASEKHALEKVMEEEGLRSMSEVIHVFIVNGLIANAYRADQRQIPCRVHHEHSRLTCAYERAVDAYAELFAATDELGQHLPPTIGFRKHKTKNPAPTTKE